MATTKNSADAATGTGPSSPAQSAVFATTELLENILIQLPWKQLFPVQRVCRKFHDVTSGSIRLQQRMFLRSCVPVESWTLRSRGPVLEDLPFARRHEFEFVCSTDNVTNAIKKAKPVELCPLAILDNSGVPAVYRLLKRPEACNIELGDLCWRPGSWRNILLTDPPCQEVTAIAGIECRARDDQGVTIGAVLDALIEALPTADLERMNNAMLTALNALHKHNISDWSARSIKVRVHLDGMVVPREDEWEQVKLGRTIGELSL